MVTTTLDTVFVKRLWGNSRETGEFRESSKRVKTVRKFERYRPKESQDFHCYLRDCDVISIVTFETVMFVSQDESWGSTSDFWSRRTNLHFRVVVTIRELPFENFRGRSPAKWKAREDRIKEAKMQRTLKIEDHEWNPSKWKWSSWFGLFHPHFGLVKMEFVQ